MTAAIMWIIFSLTGRVLMKYEYDIHIKDCYVNSRDVECIGASYIPPLPQRITKLVIKKSKFHEVSSITFKNLTYNKIKTLIMYENGLRNISQDAFAFVSELSTLEINYEPLLQVADLRSSLQSLNVSTIRALQFSGNSWTTLPEDMFWSLNKSKLNRISLDENNFSLLNMSVLKTLNSLPTFSCRKCSISHLNTQGDINVQTLQLTDNKFYNFPSFCRQSGLGEHLDHLDLSRNALTSINPQVIRCLKGLRKLVLDGNPIKDLVSHTFSDMPRLQTLSLNLLHSLETLQGSVFASMSLRILRFRRSFNFGNKGTFEPHSIFEKLPKLYFLDLTETFLPHEYLGVRMFSHLKSLKKLVLASAHFTRIPNGFFLGMPYLEVLNLQGNKISKWTTDSFKGLSFLNVLDLSGNNIKIINSTSFPKTFLAKIKVLDLSGNPYSCTCDLKWFTDLLKTSNLTMRLKSWPKAYACGSPTNLQHSFISKFHPSASECSQMRIFYIITIAVCSVLIAFFFLLFTILKCQINIRNLIYFFRIRMMFRKGYVKIKSGNDFKYHVFIVYCEADRSWVHKTLLPKLENDGLIVCVHHRDFDVGKPITENIVDCMSDSWKMVVVLSNSFSKSEWCLWELDLVQERRRQDGNEVVIVVMYEEVTSRHMTSRLRSLLLTSKYVVFKSGIGEHLFWKAVIKNINKPLNFPPTSQF